MPDLLIELLSEEIPARMQARAREDLKKRMTDGLVEAGLTYASAAAFSTPRRLALTVEGVLAASPTVREERKGPKADAPDKVIDGFLRGAGVTRDQLETRETPKGPVLFAMIERPGRPAGEIVADALEDVIRTFPWPKSMRWGSGTLRWVRPLQSILCILSNAEGVETVPLEVEGIRSVDRTVGHRFMAPNPFSVSSFDDYAAKLKRAYVVLDASERADHIWADATNQAFAAGLEVVEDPGLLTEVAGLVEWPVVLMGKIEPDFLDLPTEVLQTSMKEHQKFFSVRNPSTGRIEQFITVANRETVDHGETILAGNQKVLSARLADAKFFWENDLRVAEDDIHAWLQCLETVTFHNRLGSQGDRIRRTVALAEHLAPIIGADVDNSVEAAQLAKADLSSEVVYEFPELQGVMGRYYIERSGRPAAVAGAAEDHYSPLGPSDAVPNSPVSVVVALADKLDLLAGFWAIDEKPTGSKDPFALRRAALGVTRILIEIDVRLPLEATLARAYLTHLAMRDLMLTDRQGDSCKLIAALLDADGSVTDASAVIRAASDPANIERFREALTSETGDFQEDAKALADLLLFFHDRLKVVLKDQGIRQDIVDACLSAEGGDDLVRLVKRARALHEVLSTEDGDNLLQGFKRANNILSRAEEKDGVKYAFGADPKFAEDASERALFHALDAAEAQIDAALATDDDRSAMAALAALRGPIDAFFDAVQINTDNQVVRRNRLNILSRIRSASSRVADLSQIGG